MALIGWSLILASVLYIAIRRPPFVETLVSLCRGSPPPRRIQPPPSPRPFTKEDADQGTSSALSTHKNKDVVDAPAIGRRADGSKSEHVRRSPLTAASNPTITMIETPSTPPESESESQTTPKATAATGPTKVEIIPSFSLSTDTDPPPSAAAIARAVAGGASPPTLQKTTVSPAGNVSMPPPPVPRIPKLNNPRPGPQNNSSSSSLLATPARPSPLPDRLRQAQAQYDRQPGTSTLAPPPTHSSKPTKPSRKVTLEPGHSPLDWARLASHPTADLRGLGPNVTGYIRVTPSMLKRQTGRRGKDAWTALGGRVYNITPYLPFHPGGEPELLRAAGRDGTKLFGEIHPWVNYETMLSSCLIGLLVDENEAQSTGDMDAMD